MICSSDLYRYGKHVTVSSSCNVGMTLGVMPVTGIPWPLMSYASSNLMAVLWGLGIVNSIALRSNKTLFGN
jgi:cell division protein FtsW (lipid II flippase)